MLPLSPAGFCPSLLKSLWTKSLSPVLGSGEQSRTIVCNRRSPFNDQFWWGARNHTLRTARPMAARAPCAGSGLCWAGSWFASASLAEVEPQREREREAAAALAWPGGWLVIFKLCSLYPWSRKELPQADLWGGSGRLCGRLQTPLLHLSLPAFSLHQFLFCVLCIGILKVNMFAEWVPLQGKKLLQQSGFWALDNEQLVKVLWDPGPREPAGPESLLVANLYCLHFTGSHTPDPKELCGLWSRTDEGRPLCLRLWCG